MNILVIEDEADIRETLKDMLELNGHTVALAADGQDGIRQAAAGTDFIFCDIGMPGMDGYAVIAAIRALPPCRDVPFVFLTARGGREDQRRGMELGADDYVTKPFTEREILGVIAARLNRFKLIRDRIEALTMKRRPEAGAKWSHELLTPLNGVLGAIYLLEIEADTVNPAELKELLGMIRISAERQHRLSAKIIRHYELENLLETPPAAGPARCRAETFVVAGAQRAADQANRKADLHLAVEPAEVGGAGQLLADAVAELVENGFRFSSPGQPVVVAGRRTGATYRIEVTDNGPGLGAEQRDAVGAFKKFGGRCANDSGLGLGLVIARDTARVCGGNLSLHPGPGERGLTVAIELPIY